MNSLTSPRAMRTQRNGDMVHSIVVDDSRRMGSISNVLLDYVLFSLWFHISIFEMRVLKSYGVSSNTNGNSILNYFSPES